MSVFFEILIAISASCPPEHSFQSKQNPEFLVCSDMPIRTVCNNGGECTSFAKRG
jgi:hypothetical protein